jgi:multicomponent Na+:H+ antiporter subunit G
MTAPILDVLTVVFVLSGLFFFFAGTVGLLRFPDTLTRLHALTKADNLGFGLVVIGLVPQSPDAVTAIKLIAVWLLVLVAAASSSQLIAQFVRREETRR